MSKTNILGGYISLDGDVLPANNALNQLVCSLPIYIVLWSGRYGGDSVEGVFFNKEPAIELCEALYARIGGGTDSFRVERWRDKERSGVVVHRCDDQAP